MGGTAGEFSLLGILGGMGPEAGLEFAKILLEKTPARRDQDHLPFVLLNWPQVPDRTDFILGKGPDPLPIILDGIEILQKAGATHLVIPCNTAHIFIEEIKRRIPLAVYDMIEAAAGFVRKKYPEMERIGVIATKGTVASGIYKKYFSEYKLVFPSEEEQEKVHLAIYQGAKAGNMKGAREELLKVAESLVKMGAQAVILGCTEVETALRKVSFSVPFVKPMEAAAEVIVEEFKK